MREERTVWVEGVPHIVVLSDEKEALLAAKSAGRAVIGVLGKKGAEMASLPAAYAAENPEDVTDDYLERVVRRHLGLPWVIAETERLRIREFQTADASFVPGDEIFGQADEIFLTEEKLSDYIRFQYGFYEYGIWAVTDRTSGILVGKAGISDVSYVRPEGQKNPEKGAKIAEPAGRPGRPSMLQIELGYHIFMPYRGRGYASEACRGILKEIEKAVDGRIPYEVCAKTDAGNLASVGVIRSCGLRGVIQ